MLWGYLPHVSYENREPPLAETLTSCKRLQVVAQGPKSITKSVVYIISVCNEILTGGSTRAGSMNVTPSQSAPTHF